MKNSKGIKYVPILNKLPCSEVGNVLYRGVIFILHTSLPAIV